MTHMIDDGLGLVQATGQKLWDGVGAAASGIRDKTHKREAPAWRKHLIELAASVAGALAAFFVNRLVRARLSRHGK